MSKKVLVPADEVFNQFIDEQKSRISAYVRKSSDTDLALTEFRKIKERTRSHLEFEKKIGRSEVRTLEKQADLVLPAFRKDVEESGGSVEITVNIPNQVSVNLFDLRDEYEDLEGTPLGPVYEEEDINEANRLAEQRAMEKLESEMDEHRKVAA